MARILAQGQLLKDYKAHIANPVPLPHTGQAVPAGYDQGENLPGFCSFYDRLYEKIQEYGHSCGELWRMPACRNI